jgi:dipeptidyl aminopeptidase/acylaminoacyl peptidase
MTRGIAALTSDGWAVVRPNTRGISSEEQSAGYGQVQLEDTLLLLDALAGSAIVDTSRVALFGHSHGATMVYYYLSHSDRFIGGIAFNGAADWVYQAELARMTGLPDGMGGAPDEIPEVYEAASPYANADAIRVPLLAIVGEGDRQIPPRNGRMMIDTLRALGLDAELIAFPDEDHWVRAPTNRRLFWERVSAFLAELRDRQSSSSSR